LTYRDLFAHANLHLAGERAIIANADIFFDDTLAQLHHYDLTRKLLCLSRWDIQANGDARFFDHPASQDAWIFEAPIREFPCGFHLGVPGCDNRLAWEAANAGLCVSNPSRSIKANHLHLTGVRRYRECQRLFGPTLAVPSGFLETPHREAQEAPAASPCASIAFRESMGYSIARLHAGASSHNNDARPFVAVPKALEGRLYTQVVACSVSPVEVEFLTPGKLYVLVGNDWDGHRIATAWLSEAGKRETIPAVVTRKATGFDVWSLTGEAGDRMVLPTQVMLVAEHLERRI
jgi:hypothetical protein